MSTAASGGGDAWLVLVPPVVPIPPASFARLTWSFFLSLEPLAIGILGLALVALLRLLLFTLDAISEDVLG